MLLGVAVLVFVLAVVCALGLMFSTLTARTISSAVLSYLSVAALTVGTLIAFVLSVPILETHETVRVQALPDSWYAKNPPGGDGFVEPTPADCVFLNREQSTQHTERTWWLLALNPFVVVADAAPSRKPVTYLGFEPLQQISDGARTARLGMTAPTPESLNECSLPSREQSPEGDRRQELVLERERLNQVPAVWPYGFVFLGLIGAGATWLAVRRLRTPIRKLPRGTRIA